MKAKTLISVALLSVLIQSNAAERRISLNSLDGGSEWQLSHKKDVEGRGGAYLSTAGNTMPGAIPALVPGTTFASFVADGREECPEWGDNIYKVDEAWYNQAMWYRTEFETPVLASGEHVWLHFDNTHRYASFYFNGTKISGSIGTTRDVKGHMLRSRFDVTPLLSADGHNAVAVLITDPDPKKKRESEGLASVYVNWCSPSYMSAAGWDWMPYVPGRLSGITGNVYLRITGDAVLDDPWVRSSLPSVDAAELTVKTGVLNSSDKSKEVTLKGTITPGNITFEKTVTVAPGETGEIVCDKTTCGRLALANPRLWWPNGYGEQNLYTCRLECLVDGTVSDTRDVTFGIRKYEYETFVNSEGFEVWKFKVNGEPIFLKGGNWGISEYLLRCHGEDYETKIKLHVDMNFNMIRLWTGCVTDDEFYDYCDRYGIMVWDDFWMVRSVFDVSEPDEFKKNAVDKVRRLRNHASIALWCGANETHPNDDLDTFLANLITTEDGGDRMYKSCSNDEGLSGSGWWSNISPDDYFRSAANALENYRFTETSGYGLRSELGMGTFPQFESVELFMPKDQHWPLPDDNTLREVDNTTWNHHFFGKEGSNCDPVKYKSSVNDQYGKSDGLQEFCEKAQLLNIECMKGMFEAWNDKLWNDASGILIWMSNPAYPSFLWQTYDYYNDATGAYWGAKHACEPLHIQWNSLTGSVKVINTCRTGIANFTAAAKVYTIAGKELTECTRSASVSVAASSTSEAFVLSPKGNSEGGMRFIRLILTDAAGQVVSENFYWHNCADKYNYRELALMPEAQVECSAEAVAGESGKYIVRLNNVSDAVSFATRLRLVNPVTGERILPVFMSDNFVTLMPHETREITVEAPVAQLRHGADVLVKQFRKPEFKGATTTAGIDEILANTISDSLTVYASGHCELTVGWSEGGRRRVRVFLPQGMPVVDREMSSMETVALPSDGVYIVAVDGITRKIMVK